MTTMWSSEYSVAEHQDLEATAMAVDGNGVFVLLAGRKYLGLKNLTDTSDSLRKYPRHCKYDVGTAEWSPLQKDLCAISTNTKVEVLSWSKNNLSLVNALVAHTRVVNGLNWHQFDANILATCSIDTFTYVWDLRDCRRPAIAFSTVAGTTQVKWNKHSEYCLATAHGGDVRLWDQRKGTAPVQYITAHQMNIHCLDWSPIQANQLATAGQDCTVKFFDASNPQMTESMLTSAVPVWRAKYTPFGNGLLMVVIPPMRHGDNSLLLWNLTNLNSPVHSFVGHTDVVLEFDWGKRADSIDYQLVTWSKNQTLRIWQIEPFLQKLCRIDNNTDATLETPLTSLNSEILLTNMPLEDTSVSNEVTCLEVTGTNCSEEVSPNVISSQPKSLEQEFTLLKNNIPNIIVDSMDADKRECCITTSVNDQTVVLQIKFPIGYPHGVAPIFEFISGTSIDADWKNKILKFMKHSAQQRVKKNRPCIESCMRQLVFTLEEHSQPDDPEKLQHAQRQSTLPFYSSLNLKFPNNCIPFPRTSGAKFCGIGTLICFARSYKGLQSLIRADKTTPRSISALNDYTGSPLTVSSYYVHEKNSTPKAKTKRSLSKSSHKMKKATVVLYDVSKLLPIRKDLAEKYVLNTDDVVGMCEDNSRIAASVGRIDLSHTWSLAALAATPAAMDRDEDFPWPQHPLAIGMVHQLIEHYAKLYDIQTAAMLCCAFGNRIQPRETPKSKTSKSISPGGSPYHTGHHQVDSSVEGWTLPAFKQNRSNSWSESLDDFSILDIVVHSPWNTETIKPTRVTLGESRLYDEFKRAYAEILHRWHLLDARAQVMKYVPNLNDSEVHQGVELTAECPNCKHVVREPYCSNCKNPMLVCIVCHTAVRGAANVCLVCGHGGHTKHMLDWFTMNNLCPSGCGCQCLTETAAVLEP